VLPLGGDQITNDIAVGLRTSIPEAERIKRQHGYSLSTMISEDHTFDVPSVGGRLPKTISKKILCEIIQPRVEEIMGLVLEEIRQAGFAKLLGAGLVITGGSALLPGLIEIAEKIFDLPVRQGRPFGLGETGLDEAEGFAVHRDKGCGNAYETTRECVFSLEFSELTHYLGVSGVVLGFLESGCRS